MSYPGGKGGEGVFQTLINQIPPHSVYISPFLGDDAVLRNIAPAPGRIGVDADSTVGDMWRARRVPGLQLVHGCGIAFLRAYPWAGGEFVLADPPYVRGARRSQRDLYAHELTDAQHEELLRVLVDLPCPVMLCGYWSDLYADFLTGWRVQSYTAMTRGGVPATEFLWMNYPEPVELHDYRFLGSNFRERQDIRRQQERWRAKLEGMPAVRRYALLAALREYMGSSIGGNADGIPPDHAPVPAIDGGRQLEARSVPAADGAEAQLNIAVEVIARIIREGWAPPGGDLDRAPADLPRAAAGQHRQGRR